MRGRPRLYPEDAAWRVHLAQAKARRERLKAAGQCPACGAVPEATVYCDRCKAKRLDSQRRLRERRKAEGGRACPWAA